MIIKNVMPNVPEHQVDRYIREAKRLDRKGIHLMDAKTRKNFGQSTFSDDITKHFGTIFTPPFVVQKTVDLALTHIPETTNKLDLVYCDPACGNGNFLEYVYEKLMEETSIVDPIQRSYHILTQCLWGFEILESMVRAAKLYLWILHKKVCVKHGDSSTLNGLRDKIHIYHGNTICLPADTDQEWYQHRRVEEGGLFSAELRDKKFDVIVGNPPYTHLQNLNDRRYAAYPRQRDLAQIFVRWALDHLNEDGVCGYNITDAFLNYKTIDGAIEVRDNLDRKIREIIYQDDVAKYSKGDGGNLMTFIMIFGAAAGERSLQINGKQYQYNQSDLRNPRFIEYLISDCPTNFVRASKYSSMSGIRVNAQADKVARNAFFNTLFVHGEDNGTIPTIICKCIYGKSTTKPAFKLMFIDSVRNWATANLHSEIKIITCTSNTVAKFIWAYLNTRYAETQLRKWSKQGSADNDYWVLQLAAGTFSSVPIPDFDFYKQNRPEQLTAYLTWVEDNMRNKNAFLAGIDDQFEKLISA